VSSLCLSCGPTEEEEEEEEDEEDEDDEAWLFLSAETFLDKVCILSATAERMIGMRNASKKQKRERMGERKVEIKLLIWSKDVSAIATRCSGSIEHFMYWTPLEMAAAANNFAGYLSQMSETRLQSRQTLVSLIVFAAEKEGKRGRGKETLFQEIPKSILQSLMISNWPIRWFPGS